MNIEFSEYAGANTRHPAAFNPDFEYNGTPYISQPVRYKQTKHTSNHTYAEDIGELNCMLDGLIQARCIPAAAWKLDPANFTSLGPGVAVPDFKVSLKQNCNVFVECTMAGTNTTIRTENTLWDMSAALMEWSTSDAATQTALGGHPVTFTPQRAIGGKDERRAIDEMKRIIMTENLDNYCGLYGTKVSGSNYPVLSAVGTLVIVHDRSEGSAYAQVHTPATSYSPYDEYVSVLDAINRKISQGYATFRPVWLAVGISHVIEPWRETFDVVKGHLRDLGPFERVFVANSNQALMAAYAA